VSALGDQASNQSDDPEASLPQDFDRTQDHEFTTPDSDPPSQDHSYPDWSCQLTHTDHYPCTNSYCPELHYHVYSEPPGQNAHIYLTDQPMNPFVSSEQRENNTPFWQKIAGGITSTTTKDHRNPPLTKLERENAKLSKKLETKTNEAKGLSHNLQLSENRVTKLSGRLGG
jgi:hypothetical protein